jgi:hypothetical protein
MPKSYPSVKFIIIAVCAFHLTPVEAKTFGGKIVGIADGDTLTVVTRSKRQHKIRLAGSMPRRSNNRLESAPGSPFPIYASANGRRWHRAQRIATSVLWRTSNATVWMSTRSRPAGEWPGHNADTSTGIVISVFWNSALGWRNAGFGVIPILLRPGNGEITGSEVWVFWASGRRQYWSIFIQCRSQTLQFLPVTFYR